jgi:hypothetical protein
VRTTDKSRDMTRCEVQVGEEPDAADQHSRLEKSDMLEPPKAGL